MPVIRNVETMNFSGIEKTIQTLGEKVSHMTVGHMTSLLLIFLG